jgi:hypothetical protein
MKFKSALVTQASGSVGGATFAHNQGGLYIRARSIPVNPSTARQTVVRNALTSLSTAWVETLSDAQRQAWDLYASLVGIVGPLGDSRKIGAISMYNRCNVPRLQAGLTRIDTGPTDFTLGEASLVTLTSPSASLNVTVAYTGSNSWATGTSCGLLVYLSTPQNPTINFFKGPYQYAGRITGSATGVASPGIVVSPNPMVAGQKVFYRVLASYPDGRLSGAVTGFFRPN